MIRKNILIIGGGVAGQLLVKNLPKWDHKINIIGILDDKEKINKIVYKKIKILGKINDLKKILNELIVNKIIIAVPSENGKLIRKVLLLTSDKTNIDIELLPRVSEIVYTGKISYINLRPIEIIDLVGETIVKKDQIKVSNFMKNKIILITGAGGSIGSELTKQVFLSSPKKIIAIDFSEKNLFYISNQINNLKKILPKIETEFILGNINNRFLLESVFKKNKIHSVFHTAAYKHVPIIENNLFEGVQNNILATENLSSLANKYKIKKFMLISTDKAVKPINIMGKTKRVAEMIVNRYDKINKKSVFTAVRFGNVFNSSGSAIELFLRQIEKGEKISITDPTMTRYFMTIPEAIHLILQAWLLSKKNSIYMLEMGEPVNILQLAKCILLIKKKQLNNKFDIIGKRPGEKKHEVLYDSKNEARYTTEHKRIYAIKSKQKIDLKKFEQIFLKLQVSTSLEEAQNHSVKGTIILRNLINKLIKLA